jgi:hypothetical protein
LSASLSFDFRSSDGERDPGGEPDGEDVREDGRDAEGVARRCNVSTSGTVRVVFFREDDDFELDPTGFDLIAADFFFGEVSYSAVSSPDSCSSPGQ